MTGREPVRGCSSSIQPSGLNHRSQRELVRHRRHHAHHEGDAEDRRRRGWRPGGGRPRAGSSTAPTARNTAAEHTSARAKNRLEPQSEVGVRRSGRRATTTTAGRDEHRQQAHRQAGHRLQRRPQPGGLPGEEHLPPAGVLLAAELLGAGEDRPHRADEHHGAHRAPRGETGDGAEVVGRARAAPALPRSTRDGRLEQRRATAAVGYADVYPVTEL